MKQPTTIQMTMNFDGLIRLLADGLYSTHDIFVRELVQNCHDSIVRRRAETNNPNYPGSISIEYDTVESTIAFADNGVGMDESDIKTFLTVIGNTGTGTKRAELERRFSEALIGQFGIGMLSAFLVADKVEVLTRKLDTTDAFLWGNNGSAECTLRYDVERSEPGTTVTIHVRPEYAYLLDRRKLSEIVVRYCDFIAMPITINGSAPVNAIFAPWDRVYREPRQEVSAYSDFVAHRFPDSPMDVFPVKIDATVGEVHYRANGVLYISDRRLIGLNSAGAVDVFIRKMLVKEGDTSLLPTWAKFVRGAIDSPDLRPTASRDNVNQKDEAFGIIREALGDIIVERLEHLVEYEPTKFQRINEWHHDHLKGMAWTNDDFFGKVADLLLFHTNQGLLSLAAYKAKNPLTDTGKAPIYYFSFHDSSAQYFRMAEEKGLCIIDGGRRYDEELLEKYGKKHPEVQLQKLDSLDTGILFEEVTEGEREGFKDLEIELSHHLAYDLKLNVVVSTKRFAPPSIPAVIVETEDMKTERRLANLMSSGLYGDLFTDAYQDLERRIRERSMQLTLNADSPLIRLLAQHSKQLRSEDMLPLMVSLYNNAMIYSHRMDERNMSIVHDNVAALMTRFVGLLDEKQTLATAIETERKQSLARAAQNATADLPEHVRLFMMTPFDDSYAVVEQAVRQVFEREPYFFEIRLARDYYDERTLVKNVRSHIGSSHGFIAEISELNANVMMEVGGILMRDDDRPVFTLRSEDSKEKVPVDFGDLLRFNYDSRSQSAESIAKELHAQLVTDGRVANADLKSLIGKRSKRFLSRTILESLTDVSLKSGQIDKVCHEFTTIEDFVDADDDRLGSVGLNAHLLKAVQDELRKRLGGYNV